MATEPAPKPRRLDAGEPPATGPDHYTWREKALLTEQYEVECLLAEALGYRHDPDYGWVTGDHTIVTLAMEVRRRGVGPGTPRPAPPTHPPTAHREG